MWRAAASRLLLHRRPSPATATAACTLQNRRLLSANAEFTTGEARRVVRLVGVEMLKRSLRDRSEEVISYGEFLEECVEAGAARTHGQAEVLARAMEQSGVVLFFRGKVYLHPEKVVDLVISALPPLVEESDSDAREKEFEALKKKKQEIETQAHRQVRRIVWTGLGFLQLELGLIARLTYLEFSWDVMAPMTYFIAGFHLLAAYAYFLITSSDMSYRTFMEGMFDTRWRKLCVRHGFDIEKYRELERQIRCPLGGEHSKGSATKGIFADIEWWLSDRQKDQVDYSDAYNKLLWISKANPNHQKVTILMV
ncbi:calcium uniporter protein 6, mitochondrial-like [Triticum dicoccoides]|uniref:calcium uniporter protein 6, mitochondrial-like n=1 Tax=Triticum dicoccoides TaxID=85692 RepID=UPI001891895A|nr:calcium uniporter protein 6, mitochondrial-like [Triticum dicoccoides]